MSTYQVMPPLTGDERADLEQSIKANGVLVPVIISETGEIVDGHHRVEIADRLGMNYPQTTTAGTPSELQTLAYSLNLHRRHLTREQVRSLVETSLKADPQLSDRGHGERLGVDHKTAAKVREDMEGRGDIPHVDTRTDSLGRQQPVTRITETTKAETYVDTTTGEVLPEPEPAPKATPRQPFTQTAEQARVIGNEVWSRDVARCVWLLTGFAMHPAAPQLAGWVATEDIYAKPTTPERLRQAATYLTDLADAWESRPHE